MKTKILKKLLLTYISLIPLVGRSQNYTCSTQANLSSNSLSPPIINCSGNSNTSNNKYELPDTYTPTPSSPVLTLNLTVHVFNPAPGVGSYSCCSLGSPANLCCILYDGSNDPNHGLPGITNMLSNLTGAIGTGRLSEQRIASPGYPGTIPGLLFINDSRIQYEVTNIYFYTDAHTNTTTSTQDMANYINSINPNRLEEGMPICFNARTGQNFAGNFFANFPATSGAGLPMVSMVFDLDPFNNNYPDTGGTRNTLRHEIAHCFSLGHTYQNVPGQGSGEDWGSFGAACGSIDYLEDVYPIGLTQCPPSLNPPTNSPCNTCYEHAPNTSNNVLGAGWSKWMSPLQMGRRYRAMHLKNSVRNIRFYAKEMLSDHANPWVINTNETWDFDIQLYKDVLVKAGNTLSITCKVAMATDGKIIVEKGAKLVIDGGEVTGWCRKTPANSNYGLPLWTGIEVDGNPNLIHAISLSTGYDPNHGIVEVKNGGIIYHAHRGIKTSLTNASGQWINNTSGGIVIVSNAYFFNNVIDIVLYKHQTTKSRCKIVNSQFKTYAEIGRYPNNSLIIPHEHIKLFENWGINIQGCLFEYAAGNIYPTTTRGAGIYATNSFFNVDRYCINASCSSNIRSKFRYMTYGVFVDNFNPLYSSNIRNSDFIENGTSALFEGVDHELFSDNNLSIAKNLIGVYNFKSKYYKIRNNFFTASTSQTGISWGIVATDSKTGAHEIYRNTMEGIDVAINSIDENGPLTSGFNTTIPGLKMNCNRFNANPNKLNVYDIAATKSLAIVPMVDPKQGLWPVTAAAHYVRNEYGATNTKWYYQYVSGQTLQQIDHPSTINGPDNPFGQSSPQLNILAGGSGYVWASDCGPNTSSSGGNANNNAQKIVEMNAYINDLKQYNPNNINAYEIQSTVSSKLNLFLTDSLDESKDSVVAILESNQGGMDDADIKLVFAHMRNGNYSIATNKANALTQNRADWKALLLKIIEIEQDSMGVFSLLTNTANVSFFNGYANTEGKDGQVCAQAILRFVFGTGHEYPLVYPEEETGSKIRSLENVLPNIENPNLNVYPNPTNKDIIIHYTGDTDLKYKVEVKDLLGKTIFTTFTKLSKDYQVPLANIGNGMYLLSITNDNEEIIYQTKIIKQN